MTLAYLCISWLIGTFTGSIIAFPLTMATIALLPLLLIPLLLKHRARLLLICLCMLSFYGGNLWFQASLPKIDEQSLQFYNDQGKIKIEGIIITEPADNDRTSSFQFSAHTVTIDNHITEISGKAIIRVPRYSMYHYGDIIRINGKLETPSQFADFNYRDYLAHQGIHSVIYYPHIEIIEKDSGNKFLSTTYSIRSTLADSLSSFLPEPQCSLAQGILLGLRGNIPYSLTQAFSRTGTTHILAISGLNLSIIIGMILSIGVWLFGRRYSISTWLALAAIWLYAVFTGMAPPVIRSAIMGSMFLFAELLGRQRSASTALTFAAAVMVTIEPQILWDVSFQLSFLSMAGLIFIFPHLQSWGKKQLSINGEPKRPATTLYSITIDGLAVTSSAILATLPVIAYYFGSISLTALPANFFVIPALPPIIFSAALVSIIGLLLPLLAQMIAAILWLFLSYFIVVTQIFDALPFSSITLDSISAWQIISYYILLTGVIAIANYKNKFFIFLSFLSSLIEYFSNIISRSINKQTKKWSLISLLIAVIIIWTTIWSQPDDKLHVDILNVGQGDAILIRTPEHQNILIDGGPSPQLINIELGKKLPFWNRTIDLMISTQPQADHITGLIEVTRNFKVKQIMEPGIPSSSFIYTQWLNLIHDKEIPYHIIRTGEEIKLGNSATLEIIHPPASLLQGTSDDINNNGLVLRLTYKKVSFLFTADISTEVEWYLISQRAKLQSSVLKIAHHGSRYSTSSELLSVANPSAAVISVGSNNNFGHPHMEVMAKLNQKPGKDKVFLTSKNGTVEFITDGEKIWVTTEQ